MNNNLLVGQSGGPTSVINSSLAGVVKNGLDSKEIGKVYGMVYGIEGVLKDNIIEMDKFTDDRLLPQKASRARRRSRNVRENI